MNKGEKYKRKENNKVLTNKVKYGKNVVVIGGGIVGYETAAYCAEKESYTGEFVTVTGRETPFGVSCFLFYILQKSIESSIDITRLPKDNTG